MRSCARRSRNMSPDDLIVHAYFDVNTEILWATVTLSLPGLLAQLQTIEGLRT